MGKEPTKAELAERVEVLEESEATLRHVLLWYANPKNWGKYGYSIMEPDDLPGYARARQVLGLKEIPIER